MKNPLLSLTGAQIGASVLTSAEEEPRYYRVGRYTLVQPPVGQYTLEQDEKIQELLESIGAKQWADFLDETFFGLIEALVKKAFLRDLMDIVFDFKDSSAFSRRLRIFRMWMCRKTKSDVIRKMTNAQIGAVIEDFFVMNFSSTLTSSDTSGKTASSTVDLKGSSQTETSSIS